ncbi:hypothetical protein [Lichenifustis flavocetrariae]|uniref:(+)RNA virus helicase C-terminal domain-containing protein n=1 Tax=Lichenifustis flavocetrariae TaxID=2949735 RepID=A0AA42CR49_9HYPH|nr:hypothetical protein [Lichenifustis flavocetrariae]MCW6512095.1 hypothetical protein [Lichenifustis flavocetrariae]
MVVKKSPQTVLRQAKILSAEFRALCAKEDVAPREINDVVLRIFALADDIIRIYGLDPEVITRPPPGRKIRIQQPDTIKLSAAIGERVRARIDLYDNEKTKQTVRYLWRHGEDLLQIAASLSQIVFGSTLLFDEPHFFPLTIAPLRRIEARDGGVSPQRTGQPPKQQNADGASETQQIAVAPFVVAGDGNRPGTLQTETRLGPSSATWQSSDTPTHVTPTVLAATLGSVQAPTQDSPRASVFQSPAVIAPDSTGMAVATMEISSTGNGEAAGVLESGRPTSSQEVSEINNTPTTGTEGPRDEIRVQRGNAPSYVRTHDAAVIGERERVLRDIWNRMVIRALGPPEGTTIAPQHLTAPERGYRGEAPLLTEIRYLLAVAASMVASADDATEIAVFPQDVCYTRPAATLARIDVTADYENFFADAETAVEDLICKKIVDEPALSRYEEAVLQRHQFDLRRNPDGFAKFKPPVQYNSNNSKPPYLAAAKSHRNKKVRKYFSLREDRLKKFPPNIKWVFENGSNVLILSPAGSGKSTIIESLGGAHGVAYVNAATYQFKLRKRVGGSEQYKSWNDLLEAAKSNILETGLPTGLVVDECTMVGPLFLSQTEVFAQVILVGDPCQLGYPLSDAFAADFVTRSGGSVVKGGPVYRIKSRILFDLMNYIGYDGECIGVALDDQLSCSSLEIIKCTQHTLSKAINVVLTAIRHCAEGRRVMLATQNGELMRLVRSIYSDDVVLLKYLDQMFSIYWLSSIQGSETDVLIFDPFEVDTYITDPYLAAKYLSMLLGRAKMTISALISDKSPATTAGEIRPFSLMFNSCLEYSPSDITNDI